MNWTAARRKLLKGQVVLFKPLSPEIIKSQTPNATLGPQCVGTKKLSQCSTQRVKVHPRSAIANHGGDEAAMKL
jgi:hypothetical protein